MLLLLASVASMGLQVANGGFTSYTISTTANGAASVYAVDVDGDGRLDALSASYYNNKIVWYKNDAGSPPTWTPFTISDAANGAVSVYAVDVDGDGRVGTCCPPARTTPR